MIIVFRVVENIYVTRNIFLIFLDVLRSMNPSWTNLNVVILNTMLVVLIFIYKFSLPNIKILYLRYHYFNHGLKYVHFVGKNELILKVSIYLRCFFDEIIYKPRKNIIHYQRCSLFKLWLKLRFSLKVRAFSIYQIMTKINKVIRFGYDKPHRMEKLNII